MSKKFEPEYLTMNDIFKRENIYCIPINQRQYSWKKPQYEEYWNDILSTLDNENKRHYLGVITLVKKDEKNIRPQKYEVVDGQQRLITTALFIAALRDVYLGFKNIDKAREIHDTYLTGKTARIHYEKIISSKIDNDTIKSLVNIGSSTFDEIAIDIENDFIGRSVDLDPSEFQNNNMIDAYEYFFKNISSGFKDNGRDGEYLINIEELLLKIEVITVVSDNISNIFLYFDSLNNRGLQLNQMDIIRNKFFNVIKNKFKGKVNYFGEKWDELVVTLDDYDCIKFLKYFYMCELNNIFSSKELPNKYEELFHSIDTIEKMDRLINKMIDYAEIYKKLFSKQQQTNKEWKYIKQINFLGQQACYSFLMDYFYYTEDIERRDNMLRSILIMNYRRVVCNSSTKQLDGIFKNMISSKIQNNNEYDDKRVVALIIENTPKDECFKKELISKIWEKDNVTLYTLYLLNHNQIEFDELGNKEKYTIKFIPLDSKISKDVRSYILVETKLEKEEANIEDIARNTDLVFTREVINKYYNKKDELSNDIINTLLKKTKLPDC